MENPVLFGSLEYSDSDELNRFIDEMTQDKAVVILTAAAAKAQDLNVYTNEESMTIIKAIKILTVGK